MVGLIVLSMKLAGAPQTKTKSLCSSPCVGSRPDTNCLESALAAKATKSSARIMAGGPQGVFLEGAGLELRSFVGSFQNGWTPNEEVNACDPDKPVATAVKLVSCDQRIPGAWECAASVPGGGLCGQSTAEFRVIVVDGHWDKTGKFVNTGVTMSCWDGNERFEKNGAVAGCVTKWHYSPKNHPNEFQACVRAYRADFCGNGFPHNAPTRWVDMKDDKHNTDDVSNDDVEAEWDEQGAWTFGHARVSSAVDPFPLDLQKPCGTPRNPSARTVLRAGKTVLTTRSKPPPE